MTIWKVFVAQLLTIIAGKSQTRKWALDKGGVSELASRVALWSTIRVVGGGGGVDGGVEVALGAVGEEPERRAA